jgi:hypothetical protein
MSPEYHYFAGTSHERNNLSYVVACLFLVVCIWLAISAIQARASGWLQLTKQFPDRNEQPLICLRRQPSTNLILRAMRSMASRRMIQEAAPVVRSGARFETRRLAAPLLSTRGLVS